MEEIEARAEAVLASLPDWIWDGETLPVPVEDIVDSQYRLHVRDVEDMTEAPGCPELEPGQQLSGLLLPSQAEIWVNASEAREWPTRRRFTICHELGHWVLHRSGQQSLFCRHGSVDESQPAATTKPPLPITEEEANAFAAALLMPAELMRVHYAETGGSHAEMCERFGASGVAMGRRMHAVISRSSNSS